LHPIVIVVVIADIARAIAVRVTLIGVGLEGAIVERGGQPITIGVIVANIPYPIPIEIDLPRIGIEGTIVLTPVSIGQRGLLTRLIDDTVAIVVDAIDGKITGRINTLLGFVYAAIGIVVAPIGSGWAEPVVATVQDPIVVVVDITGISIIIGVRIGLTRVEDNATIVLPKVRAGIYQNAGLTRFVDPIIPIVIQKVATGVASAIALTGLVDGRITIIVECVVIEGTQTIGATVEDTVSVIVRITCIPLPVLVGVHLVAVFDQRTIVLRSIFIGRWKALFGLVYLPIIIVVPTIGGRCTHLVVTLTEFIDHAVAVVVQRIGSGRTEPIEPTVVHTIIVVIDVTDIAHAVTIGIALEKIGRPDAIVDAVVDAIPIVIVITGITQSVAIDIGLVRIRIKLAIVLAGIRSREPFTLFVNRSVAIIVDAIGSWVTPVGALSPFVNTTIGVVIASIGGGRTRAAITTVQHPVTVVIVVADVAESVAVGIQLAGIADHSTVVFTAVDIGLGEIFEWTGLAGFIAAVSLDAASRPPLFGSLFWAEAGAMGVAHGAFGSS